MRRFMNFLAGAMCGALVGAVTALLMAPTSGEVLQQRLRNRTSALRDEIREAYDTRMAQLEAELEALRKPPKPTEEEA
jgi:gas vesicle protein